MISTGLPIYLLLYLVGSSCGTMNKPPEKGTANPSGQDTVIIAISDQPVHIDVATPSKQVYLKAQGKNVIDKSRKTFLQFEGIRLDAAPDGVYEIYLSSQKTVGEKLTAESRYFVNVLDPYLLTGNAPRHRLEIDITRSLEKIMTGQTILSGYYLTLQFKGNMLKGQPSAKAGQLFIREIRLVQMK